jgi:hypothetical protein
MISFKRQKESDSSIIESDICKGFYLMGGFGILLFITFSELFLFLESYLCFSAVLCLSPVQIPPKYKKSKEKKRKESMNTAIYQRISDL